jgi:hypothetical protein
VLNHFYLSSPSGIFSVAVVIHHLVGSKSNWTKKAPRKLMCMHFREKANNRYTSV